MGDNIYNIGINDMVFADGNSVKKAMNIEAKRLVKLIKSTHGFVDIQNYHPSKYYNKQNKFKNVVYEYPLSKAIEDGYTRTPFAATRTDIDFYNFGDEQLDKLMINDGIICHEKTKKMLSAYASNNNRSTIKPFAMIVCKDTKCTECHGVCQFGYF